MSSQVITQRPGTPPSLGDDVACSLPEDGSPPVFISAVPGKLATQQEFFEWVTAHRPELDRVLVEHGAIVFRGFPLATAEDFDRFSALYPSYEDGYVGGASPRSSVVGKVMEATRLAPQFKIALHQEMAYLRKYPKRIAFFSRLVPREGGETIIADMRTFTARLSPSLRERLEQHGVRGVRNYGPAGEGGRVAQHIDDKPWDEGFGTTERSEVEAICARMGMQPIWNADGSLTVVTHTDAFSEHPITGERFYRNIIHSHYIGYEDFAKDNEALEQARTRQAFHTGYALGNGVTLSREESRELEDLLDEITVKWKWQNGDVLLIDNIQTAHGRNAYVGERETLVTLLD